MKSIFVLLCFESNEPRIGNRSLKKTEHVGRVSKLDVCVEKQNSKCRIENSEKEIEKKQRYSYDNDAQNWEEPSEWILKKQYSVCISFWRFIFVKTDIFISRFLLLSELSLWRLSSQQQ
jgi:hypothetical protein